MIRGLVLLVFLFVAAAAHADPPQPCAPFRNTLNKLAGTPCGSLAVARTFHTAADHWGPANGFNGLDPRYLVAVAKAVTNGGAEACGVIANDPFAQVQCTFYGSLIDAIEAETAYLWDTYISKGLVYLDYINSHELFSNPVAIRAHFADLLGNPSAALWYTTSCCGDCNRNQVTSVDELVYAVILTGCLHDCPPLSACPWADADFNGVMTITDVIRDVLSAIGGCPSS